MRNLTAPKQYTDTNNRTTFDAGTECLMLYTAAGDPVNIRVATDGWLYVNEIPFGVAGMPPAPHKATHFTGGVDAIAPADIGAADATATTAALATVTANANSRVLQTAYDTAMASVLSRLAALEANAVTSTNISAITGNTLADGVGTLNYTTK
jgi:hypothetical protein